MALVRALENRRKMEEKEKKRLEARAERIATKEKRAEQRRVEMELIEQIRKPVEDMELTGMRERENDRYRAMRMLRHVVDRGFRCRDFLVGAFSINEAVISQIIDHCQSSKEYLDSNSPGKHSRTSSWSSNSYTISGRLWDSVRVFIFRIYATN